MNAEIVERIKNREWFQWGTRRLTLSLIERWGSPMNYDNFFGVGFPDRLFLLQNEKTQGFLDKQQFEDTVKRLLSRLLDSSFFDFWEKEGLPILSDFIQYCKSISVLGVDRFSKKELSTFYQEFLLREDQVENFLWTIFLIDEYFSNEFARLLKKHFCKCWTCWR